jgi:hypothetical protein
MSENPGCRRFLPWCDCTALERERDNCLAELTHKNQVLRDRDVAMELERARLDEALGTLARRTIERDRARYLAQQLVDRLDYVSRVEMAEAIDAAMADEVES